VERSASAAAVSGGCRGQRAGWRRCDSAFDYDYDYDNDNDNDSDNHSDYDNEAQQNPIARFPRQSTGRPGSSIPGRPALDQDAFRETYAAVNERRCPYEKAILTNNCGCALAQRFCIAEREGVRCDADAAQARCLAFLERLRNQARFALKTTDGGAALPHAKAMRIQVGGLRGVRAALAGDAPQGAVIEAPVDDVDGLLRKAVERFGSLAELPFGQIILKVAAYRGRPSFGERRRARKAQAKDEQDD
jgi:hypothetical protein